MTSQPIISVRDLSKSFSFFSRPVDLVYELISGKPRHDVFWALRDVSFEVAEGDRLGISSVRTERANRPC